MISQWDHNTVHELKLILALRKVTHSVSQQVWAVALGLALINLGIQMRTQTRPALQIPDSRLLPEGPVRTQTSPALQGPASHLLPEGPVLLVVSWNDRETVVPVRANPG